MTDPDRLGHLSEVHRQSIRNIEDALRRVVALQSEDILTESGVEQQRRPRFQQVFTLCQELARALQNRPLYVLGAESLDHLTNRFVTFAEASQELAASVPADRSAQQVKPARLERWEKAANELIDQVSNSAFPLAFVDPSDDIKADLVRSHTQMKQLLAETEEGKKRLDNLLTSAEDLVRNAAVASQAAGFANAVETKSKSWLAVTGITAGLVIVLAGIFLCQQFSDSPPGLIDQVHLDFLKLRAIQLALPKLVLMSVLLSAAIWAGKIYRANRHLAEVNRHRANALYLYERLMNSTEDPQAKHAILTHALHAIFTPLPTGFVQQDGDLSGGAKAIEFVQDLSRGKM